MKQSLTKIKIAAVVILISFLSACSSKFEKTASGLVYKIKKGSGKEVIKTGNWIQYNIEYKLGKKDTILYSTYSKVPEFAMVDIANLPKYNVAELIPKLHTGDKVEFVINVDSMVKKGIIREYNQVFTKGDVIKGRFDMVKIYANEEACKADRDVAMSKAREFQKADMEKQAKEMKASADKDLKEYLTKNKAMFEKQITALKDYASKNNIQFKQTALGTLVAITTPGVGNTPVDGNFASIMYRGYLENGKVFDANLGADAKHKDPLPMVFGQAGTIPGFEDGLKLFTKGAKGKILIPAALAYRENANQEIPGNSNLIFDIEMTDLSDKPIAPKQEAQPQPSASEGSHDEHKH